MAIENNYTAEVGGGIGMTEPRTEAGQQLTMTESLDALWDEMYRAIRVNRDGQLMIALRGRIEAASADNEGPPEPGIDRLALCEERERDLRDALLEASYFHVKHDGTPRHPATCHECRARLSADGDSPGGAE